MTAFEIYTKEVTIATAKGDKVLTLRPLSGRFLPKLYSIMGKMDFKDVESENGVKLTDAEKARKFFNQLDEPTVAKLHEICLETLKKSYPQEDATVLDEFVSQHLLALFPAVFEVNLGKEE